MKKIIVIGGGTFAHVRSHMSFGPDVGSTGAPAFGETAKDLAWLLSHDDHMEPTGYDVQLRLTKMADPKSALITNADVSRLLDELIEDPDVRCIVFNPALVDFSAQIGDIPSGKHAERLKTADGEVWAKLTPEPKLIGKIRQHRKDIFVVGFKTTTNASAEEQYAAGLKLLKTNSLNLVLANDTVTRRNVIIAPEETQYGVTTDRDTVLNELAKMTLSRLENTFTRSKVVSGAPVRWDSELVPANLREVVDFCIERGAYKTVLGRTAGHFAVKVSDTELLTSIRKSNFNKLHEVGMVKVTSTGPDSVIAHGFKPSVGGQSQRIIFSEHRDVDCIVHFHCPPKSTYNVATRPQWPNECGSHQCGANTSDGLQKVDLGDDDYLKVVYLENHGPNIVFDRQVPAWKVKKFINDNFVLEAKTGGLVPASVQ